MNPRPQTTTTPETRPALALEEANRQEVLAAFASVPATKPALPLNAGLVIRVQGETFQATTLAGEPVTFALLAPAEKIATQKNAIPAAATNVVPQ